MDLPNEVQRIIVAYSMDYKRYRYACQCYYGDNTNNFCVHVQLDDDNTKEWMIAMNVSRPTAYGTLRLVCRKFNAITIEVARAHARRLRSSILRASISAAFSFRHREEYLRRRKTSRCRLCTEPINGRLVTFNTTRDKRVACASHVTPFKSIRLCSVRRAPSMC